MSFSVEKNLHFFLSANIEWNTNNTIEKYATHFTEPVSTMTFLSNYAYLTFRFHHKFISLKKV